MRNTPRTAQRERALVREFLDSVNIAVWSYDQFTNRLTVSPGLQALYGYTQADFDRHPQLWKEVTVSEDLESFAEHMSKLDDGISSDNERRIVDASGSVKWLQCIATPVLNENGEVVKLYGIENDISARKTMEEALNRSEQRYKSLFDRHSDSILELDRTGAIRSMNRSATRSFGVKNTGEAMLKYTEIMSEEGVIRSAKHFMEVMRGEPQRFELTTLHPDGHFVDWDVKFIPIYINDKVDGVYAIGNDITDKKNVEKALAASEEMYRVITDNIEDLVSVIDLDGDFLFASPSYRKVLGCDPATLISTSCLDWVIPEEREQAAHAIRNAADHGDGEHLRLRCRHADGSLVYINFVGTPVRNEDGRILSLVVAGRDVTDEVRFEMKLVESEKRYRRLIELSPVPILSHQDGRIQYANTAGLKLFGADHPELIIGKSVRDIVIPDQTDVAMARIRESKSTKYVAPKEYQLIRLDGQTIEVVITSIYDDETGSNLVVVHDVTEQKQMQAALRDSEERYRRMVEMSPMSIVVYKNNQVTYVNPACLRNLGAAHADEIVGLNPLCFVHPKYQELVRNRMLQTMREGHSPPAEYELIGLDGRVIDVSVTAIYDAVSSSVLLVFMDISARKHAEKALLESEEMNRRLVELLPEAIVLHSDYQFIYANPAAYELFKVKGKDVTGLSVIDRIHPEDRDRAADRLDKVYDEFYTSPLVEQKIIRLDGSVVDVEVITAPIAYRGKDAAISVFRDITERNKEEELRKLAERELVESKDRFLYLQASLDRFSSDLFGHVNVTELERRLVQEVREVLQADSVSLIEVDGGDRIRVRNGSRIPDPMAGYLPEWSRKNLPICRIMDSPHGFLLKIGVFRGKQYLLCIGGQPLSLAHEPVRIWLETICRYVCVLYDNFRVIEDLTRELEQSTQHHPAPSWLLRLLFKLNEHERKRLSQDLHDAALQEQIIWYRKLDQLMADPALSAEMRDQLDMIAQGLLDVIYQIRITCIDLRPPMLKEEGIVTSLESLFEFTQMRSDYSIEFHAADFDAPLTEEHTIGLYRIVQELLANATKHSNATKVAFSLIRTADGIQLSYEDNGIGMDMKKAGDAFVSMGVYGMKERVHSLNGKIVFQSSPNKGLSIEIRIPFSEDGRNNQKEAWS